MQSKPAEFTGISVDSGVELQSVKEKISDHFSASEKVLLLYYMASLMTVV